MPEFRYKPVELYGKYDASPASVSSGTQTDVLTDNLGRLSVVGGTHDGASTVGVNPLLIAAVDANGSISTLKTTDVGLKVDTEMILNGTIVANVLTFSNYAGSMVSALVDSNRRQEVVLAAGTQTAGTITALQGTSPWTVNGTITSTPSGTQDTGLKTIAGTTLTSGTLDTYTKGRLQSSTILWSAYNTGTATYTSGASTIATQQIKTLALYITQTSTAVIQVQPVSGASWYDYYTDNAVSSNTYWSKSFTEQAYQVRLAVTPSANSTLDAWFIGQS